MNPHPVRRMVPSSSVLRAAAVLLVLLGAAVGQAEPIAIDLGGPAEGLSAAIAPRPWTRDEMLSARPLPLPSPSRPGGGEMPLRGSQAAGLPGTYPGGAPGIPWSASEPVLGEPVESGGGGYAYPPPYNRFAPSGYYLYYPKTTIGRLFLTLGGERYTCSAASVGNNAIWTAGHCVWDAEMGAAENIVFVPSYRDGRAPFGQWRGARIWTTSEWKENMDFRRDMGGVILKKKGGRKISRTVGWLGFAWNQDVNQLWTAYGYPMARMVTDEDPFSGERMIQCNGSYAYSDADFAAPPFPNGMGCDMTGGASGGPWIVNYGGTGSDRNLLNGNVSYRFQGVQRYREFYSPYFDDAARELYESLITDRP
jgi:hypothetical protein